MENVNTQLPRHWPVDLVKITNDQGKVNKGNIYSLQNFSALSFLFGTKLETTSVKVIDCNNDSRQHAVQSQYVKDLANSTNFNQLRLGLLYFLLNDNGHHLDRRVQKQDLA